MKVLCLDNFACSLSMLARLNDEGHEVRWYIAPPSHKSVGDGIIEKVGTIAQGMDWAKSAALRREPVLVFVASSGLGEAADAARKAGLTVIGGGTFCDKLEQDRSFGQDLAAAAGATLPNFEEFPNVEVCLKRCAELGEVPVYFKSDAYVHADATHGADSGGEMAEYLADLRRSHPVRGTCVLQERIDGVPFSTARWWNGMAWVGPYEFTYENKKFMAGDVGPSTGCALNAIWFDFEDEPAMAKLLGWEGLTPAFRMHHAPPGLYDLNAIVTPSGQAYYLETTARQGYDSEPTSMRLIPDLGAHLWAVANGKEPPAPSKDLAYAVRLSVPPYPSEFIERSDEASSDGTSVRGADGLWDGNFIAYQVRDDPEGELQMAGPEGIVGLALAVGDDIEALGEEVADFAKTLRVAGLQWRCDGAADCARAAERLEESGVSVHPGLLGAKVNT